MMAVSQLTHSVTKEFLVTSRTKLLMISDLSCGALLNSLLEDFRSICYEHGILHLTCND